jgi:hypothetical protein
LIILVLLHGRLPFLQHVARERRVSGSPLNPATCRTTRLAYP